MHYNHITIPRLLFGILLLAALTGCENRLVLEDRMKDVVGEYRLEVFGGDPITLRPILNQYEQEIAAISIARIFPFEDKWYFDYTLPIISNGTIHFHHIQQQIYWDRQLGAYYFSRLKAADLPDGWDPDEVSVLMDRSAISFSSNHCGFIWYKH